MQQFVIAAAIAAHALLPAAGAARDLALVDVELVAAPDAERLAGATVIVRDGRIAEVGVGLDVRGLPVIDGGGRVAVAGFWNSHVHLTDRDLLDAPAPVLHDMLLRYGVTSIVDTGSFLQGTLRLIDAIDSGRVAGPDVIVANGSFVYRDGTPAYLPGITLPELSAPHQAGPAVDSYLDAGAQGIKIFSGSFKSPTETVLLPTEIVRAVVNAAHARGSFVMAHPTSREGLVNAVDGGVDVLVHTAPPAGPLGGELVATMRDAGIALIPTLMLWRWELERAGVPSPGIDAYEAAGVAQLAEYFAAGGEILFGTDVGYMREFDPTREYVLMARAGMGWRDVLASLTTHPARRFTGRSGTVTPGEPADLVLLAADPEQDVTALARVAMTLRKGVVVHEDRL